MKESDYSSVLVKNVWEKYAPEPKSTNVAVFKKQQDAVDFVNRIIGDLAFLGMANINTGHIFLDDESSDNYITLDIDVIPTKDESSTKPGNGFVDSFNSISDAAYIDSTMNGKI